MNDIDATLRRMAASFDYPPTPDVGRRVRARLRERHPKRALSARLAVAMLAAAFACAVVFAVPQVRAAVLRVLRIGSIAIEIPAPTPRAQATATATTAATATAARQPTRTPTSVQQLEQQYPYAGRTTLMQARATAPFTIPLPSAAGFGEPDLVFVQRMRFSEAVVTVVLVWLDPADATRPRVSLQILSRDVMGGKGAPELLRETTVRGRPAVWGSGAHPLTLSDGREEWVRIVTGNVLVWERDGITYRLESALPMAEAVRIAESLE